jgi:hypothetical protein
VPAVDIVPVPGESFEQTLVSASPDVLREMIQAFAQKMMDAEVEVACGAGRPGHCQRLQAAPHPARVPATPDRQRPGDQQPGAARPFAHHGCRPSRRGILPAVRGPPPGDPLRPATRMARCAVTLSGDTIGAVSRTTHEVKAPPSQWAKNPAPGTRLKRPAWATVCVVHQECLQRDLQKGTTGGGQKPSPERSSLRRRSIPVPGQAADDRDRRLQSAPGLRLPPF